LLTWCWRPKTLTVLMDPRPLLPFVFLLRSPAYMFLLFSQQLWSWEGDEEADLLWIGFDSGSFSVCRDESNCKANPPLCVAPLLFLLFSAFFFCVILWFLVFCLGLASVPPFFFFCASLLWFFYSRRMACVSLGNEDSGPFIAGAVMAGASVSLVWWAEEDEQFSWNDAVRLLMAICVLVLDVLDFS